MEKFYEFCGLQRQAKLRQEAEHHRLIQELSANHSLNSQRQNWLKDFLTNSIWGTRLVER